MRSVNRVLGPNSASCFSFSGDNFIYLILTLNFNLWSWARAMPQILCTFWVHEILEYFGFYGECPSKTLIVCRK